MLAKKALADFKAVMLLNAINKFNGKRKAAKELDISIDTLSKYVDTLEQECGSKLFNSTATGTSLTMRGERIADYSAELEEVLKHMYAIVSNKEELVGEVKLLWDRHARANTTNKRLWDCLKKYKRITLTSTTVDKVNDNKNLTYDILITYELPTNSDWELIYSKKTVTGFFASAQYLKKYGYPQTKEEMLSKHRMVLLREDKTWMHGAGEYLYNAKNKAYLGDSSFAINEAVEVGVGIGILPMSFVGKGLVCLDNIKSDAVGTVYMLVHKQTKNNQRVKVIAEHLKSMLDNA